MPNRIIKESIHESEKINSLSDFQFRLWTYLLTYVDDYGRGDARPAIIKGNCFPLRDRLTTKDIEAALNTLADTGCIGLYEVDGKSYLYFPNWGRHQRIQNKRSKYPSPEDSTAVHRNPPSSTVSHRESLPESNPNPNPIVDDDNARTREEPVVLDLTPDELIASMNRDQMIEQAARDAGLAISETAMVKARDMACQFGIDKVIDAIKETSLSAQRPSWKYVEGILEGRGKRNDNRGNFGGDSVQGRVQTDYSWVQGL